MSLTVLFKYLFSAGVTKENELIILCFRKAGIPTFICIASHYGIYFKIIVLFYFIIELECFSVYFFKYTILRYEDIFKKRHIQFFFCLKKTKRN